MDMPGSPFGMLAMTLVLETEGMAMTETETKVREFVDRRRKLTVWHADKTDAIVLTPFENLGLTSLEIVEVVMDCEQAHGIEIADSVISSSLTIAALAAEVDRRRMATPASRTAKPKGHFT